MYWYRSDFLHAKPILSLVVASVLYLWMFATKKWLEFVLISIENLKLRNVTLLFLVAR